jgi:hypothetical protein
MQKFTVASDLGRLPLQLQVMDESASGSTPENWTQKDQQS